MSTAAPPPPPRARPLEPDDLAAARKVIADRGLASAAKDLDLPRQTLANAASGADLREGTRMVVSARLRRRGG